MRDFILQTVQCFLTDQFCHNLTFRLICHCVLIIKLWSIWKIFHNDTQKFIRIVTTSCRYRNNICKVINIFVCSNCRQNLFSLHRIHLIDDENDRCLDSLKLLCNMLFARSDKCSWLHKPKHDIHFIQCFLSHIYHVLTKLVFRLVNSWCINKYNLTFICCQNCLNPVTCCLRFVRCNGNLLADQVIHQCRFSYIRTSDQCHKTRLKIIFHIFSSQSGTPLITDGDVVF